MESWYRDRVEAVCEKDEHDEGQDAEDDESQDVVVVQHVVPYESTEALIQTCQISSTKI